MKKFIFLLAILINITINYNANAQASSTVHLGGGSDYCGWDINTPINFDLRHDGPHNIRFFTESVQRMIIRPGAGPTGGYVGIGNSFNLPASRLHVQQGTNQTVWFQMTGNNMGSLFSDGLRIGVLNSVAAGPFDVEVRQQENAPMNFFTTDSTSIKERFRIHYGRGGNNAGGYNTNGGITKTFISRGDGVGNTLPPSVSMLNIGTTGLVNPSGGRRAWMDVGTYYNWDSDNMYVGLKDEGTNQKNSIINWGDDPFVAPDTRNEFLRFIYTSFIDNNSGGAGTNDGYDFGTVNGMEIARMTSSGTMGIGSTFTLALPPQARLDIFDDQAAHGSFHPALPQLRLTQTQNSSPALGRWTDFTTTTRGDLFIHPDSAGVDKKVGINISIPGNTLEINATPGVSPELAGLRFTDLINTVTPITNPTSGVLSVDSDGDVIWVRDSTFSGGNATICTPVMPADLNFITKWTSAAPQICRTTGIYEESGGNFNVGIGIPSITSPPITNFDAKLQVDGKILMTTNGGVFSNNGIYQYNNSNFPRRILAMYGLNNEGVIAVGMRAGNNDPSSSQCVFIGDSAGSHTASANFNVFVGAQAGRDYIGTGEPGANTFMGDRSGLLFTSGSANTLLGSGAGGALTGANRNDNTMVGTSAGANVASGNSNCYVGRSSGTFRSGDENVMLGVLANATGSGTTSYNRMALGAKASVACDSCAVIGNLSQRIGIGTVHPLDTISLTVDSRGHKIAAVFSGQVGIGLANTTNLPVVDSAQLSVFVTSGRSNAAYFNGDVYATGGYNPLDADLEMNVQQDTIQANFFDNLNVYSFDFDTVTYRQLNLPKTRQVGFLAGDIQAKAPQLVKNMHVPAQTDFMGVSHPAVDFSVVNTNGLIPYLVGAVQRERVRINILRAHLISLQAQINACCNTRTIDPDSGTNDFPINQTIDLASSDPILYQNQPNPFDNSTTIRYFISENSKQPKIIFQDETGRTINETAITELGQGSILINAASLNNGIYTYSLQIDGKIIDSKKMIRTK